MRKAIALLALLATVSCGDDIEKRFEKANAALPAPAAPAISSNSPIAKVGATYMDEWNTHPDRSVDVKYDIGSDHHTLHGTARTDDERDYVVDGASSPSLTVKSQPDSFKILTGPGGTLRWKVKIDGDQVKISDNDQNTNAWMITTTPGKVSVVTSPDNRVVGTVKYESGKNVVRDGSDKLIEKFPSKIFRPGYGTLLIDGVIPPERFVMMVELIDAMPDHSTVADVNAVRGTDLDSWNIDGHNVALVKYGASGKKHVLSGVPIRNGKQREYRLDNGAVVADAVQTGNGFIVQSPSGQNRWTVAINGNTMTIAGGDHDETYEIVTSDSNHASISGHSGKALGTVSYANGYDTTSDAQGDAVDEMPSRAFRAAYGVLLLDGVSPVERYVILVELIDKTR